MAEPIAVARWWREATDSPGRAICELCPRACRIGEDETGFCKVRRYESGKLRALTYGYPASFAIDPIEKKPLFHFLPASRVLSFGTVGCTLGCRFCQNWTLSRGEVAAARERFVSPQRIVDLALQDSCPSIAYTYNEPTVFGEYMADTAARAREQGLRNVAVTNGYVTPRARPEVFADIDAANVDLKAFSDEFYVEQTQAHLAPVLDTLRWIAHETSIWLEVTTLLIPGLNDGDEMIQAETAWLVENVGPETPLHLTAFHPAHRMQDRERTPGRTLARARSIARQEGLKHVYLGNVADADGQSTRCAGCDALLIERSWHATEVVGLDEGRCRQCGAVVPGLFR